ncbi:MAG TPA: hypothetical protein VHQ65_03500 [Thermoanaerobaculia bacterium]|nr:hypothetical protein [Thermoanaerobaculia bacterium]
MQRDPGNSAAANQPDGRRPSTGPAGSGAGGPGLLQAKRREIDAVLARYQVPAAEAPRLVREALLAVTSEADGFPAGTRLVRALELVCSRRAGDAEAAPTIRGTLRALLREMETDPCQLAYERQTGPAEAAEVLALDAETRREVLEHPSCQTVGLVEGLLQEARSNWSEDTARALAAAEAAYGLACRLDVERYGVAALNDLTAKAVAYLGNSRRVAGDLVAAERAFAEAGERLAQGTLDPALRADVLGLEAALLRDQRRFEQSLAVLGQALAIQRWRGDLHLEARLLLRQAHILDEMNEPREAARVLHRALHRLDPEREPRLEYVAIHNLATVRLRLGQIAAAESLLPRVRALCHKVGQRLDHLHVRWLAALLQLARRRPDAEEDLLALREELLAEGLTIDAALVSLDVAVARLRTGRTGEARALADELVPVFAAQDIGREGLAALLVLQQALRLEQATVAAAQEAAIVLRRSKTRHRHPPGAVH